VKKKKDAIGRGEEVQRKTSIHANRRKGDCDGYRRFSGTTEGDKEGVKLRRKDPARGMSVVLGADGQKMAVAKSLATVLGYEKASNQALQNLDEGSSKAAEIKTPDNEREGCRGEIQINENDGKRKPAWSNGIRGPSKPQD